MTIIVRAEFHTEPENRGPFEFVAQGLRRAAAAEPGTLRYDWYSAAEAAGTAVFVVVEEYVDDAAAMSHNDNCADLLLRAGDLADMRNVQIHGDLGPALSAWVAEHQQASAYTPLPGVRR